MERKIINWESLSRYCKVPGDLGLTLKLNWAENKYPVWNIKSIVPHEEALQTVLSLNLSEICGEEIQLIGKAGDYWGEADIIGIDRLNRIHLFELKRGQTISKKDAVQLSYYLMKRVFHNPDNFRNRWWKRMGENELAIARFCLSLAGFFAGQQTHNIGPKILGLDDKKWKKIDTERRNELLIDKLLTSAQKYHENVPTAEELTTLAGEWRRKLWGNQELLKPIFSSSSKVVIWLVGPKFSEEAEEEIRKWRAAGVDARLLEAELRFSQNQLGAVLRIRRENFPSREKLNRKILNWVQNNKDNYKFSTIRLNYYKTVQPSASLNKKKQSGFPLDKVFPTFYDKDGKELKVKLE